MTRTPDIICVPYQELEVAAKWMYYGTKILKDMRSRLPKRI